MSEHYIRRNFDEIKAHASVIENRMDDADCTIDALLRDNAAFRNFLSKSNTTCIFIDHDYEINTCFFDALLKNEMNVI